MHARLFICEKNVALHGLIRHLFLFFYFFFFFLFFFYFFYFFFRITIISCSLKCTTVSVRQLYFVRTALANAGTLYSDLLASATDDLFGVPSIITSRLNLVVLLVC